ncbi:MAG: hypothetical protein HRU06_01555 [Oceanospirillaceae bacterium]|nr:hypothetical protein [Oceanospirillaceae bacterium]
MKMISNQKFFKYILAPHLWKKTDEVIEIPKSIPAVVNAKVIAPRINFGRRKTDSELNPNILYQAELYTVSIFINVPEKLTEIIDSLADYLKKSNAQVYKIIFTSPGIVLDQVNLSVVKELQAMLANKAELICARKENSKYRLEVDQNRKRIKEELIGALSKLSIIGKVNSKVLACDISFENLTKIWTEFGASRAIKFINQDFLRYDVQLGNNSNFIMTDEISAYLKRKYRFSDSKITHLGSEPSITLVKAVSACNIERDLLEFRDLGLCVQAKEVSFSRYKLRVLNDGIDNIL